METSLKQMKIAVLTDSGFEEVELTIPKKALEDAGAEVHIISIQPEVKGWDTDHWSITIPTDVNLHAAAVENYDALLVPGGVINPDKMRKEEKYVAFAQHFLETGKPLAAICHGPQLLIETGMLSGREMTSYPSIKTDLINAGVIWHDKEVVSDNGLVTSRSPEDIPAFISKMLEVFAEGQRATTAAFTRRISMRCKQIKTPETCSGRFAFYRMYLFFASLFFGRSCFSSFFRHWFIRISAGTQCAHINNPLCQF